MSFVMAAEPNKSSKKNPMNEPNDGGAVNKRLREALLIEDHGTPDAQKTALVDEIINSFQNPEKWPITDSERIALLRSLMRRALTIRRTEDAMLTARKNERTENDPNH